MYLTMRISCFPDLILVLIKATMIYIVPSWTMIKDILKWRTNHGRIVIFSWTNARTKYYYNDKHTVWGRIARFYDYYIYINLLCIHSARKFSTVNSMWWLFIWWVEAIYFRTYYILNCFQISWWKNEDLCHACVTEYVFTLIIGCKFLKWFILNLLKNHFSHYSKLS